MILSSRDSTPRGWWEPHMSTLACRLSWGDNYPFSNVPNTRDTPRDAQLPGKTGETEAPREEMTHVGHGHAGSLTAGEAAANSPGPITRFPQEQEVPMSPCPWQDSDSTSRSAHTCRH